MAGHPSWRRIGAAVLAAAVLAVAAWWAEDAGWFDASAVPVSAETAKAMLADVNAWDAATAGERRGVAEQVDARLDDFTLLRVRSFGFEGHRHEIAVFRHETTGLEFSLVPGGTFTMGSPATEAGRFDDEIQRPVTLTRSFLVARTECTQAAWERVMRANPSTFSGPRLPVEMVSWDDATAFSAKAGLRLPTEAEWEFACRAGTTTAYWSGDAEADLARVGWWAENRDTMPPWLRRVLAVAGGTGAAPDTNAVGSLPPNPFGLHDVHGNVWEWCADGYGAYPSGNVADPPGPGAPEDRVLRGGSWAGPLCLLRCASRGSGRAAGRAPHFGFRPARSVPGEP